MDVTAVRYAAPTTYRARRTCWFIVTSNEENATTKARRKRRPRKRFVKTRSVIFDTFVSSWLRARERRHPGVFGPARAVARHFDVDQVRLAVRCEPARAAERGLEVGGRLRPLAVHAKALCDRRHVDIGLAEVVVHELVRVDRSAGPAEIREGAVVRAAVGVVVVDDHGDRQLQSRHVPESSGPEQERTVADQADDLLARPGNLHACGRADA